MRNRHLPITEFEEIEPETVEIHDSERQERDEKIIGWFENAFHILNAYQAHQSGEKDLRMSLRAMEMALGFQLAAGADGPAELARKCGVSKQALGKCLNHFMAQLKLQPLAFQRKEEARLNMAEARREQVQKLHK